MEEDMPKVSVLTPIYNTKEEHLRKTIQSILNQTFKNFEFLILNDSPNNPKIKNIVKSFNDNRIIYLENKENLGISASRNKLITLAKGKYLAVVDHDDISEPYRLEKEVSFLDKHKDIGVISGNIHYMHGNFDTNHPCSNLEIKQALLQGCVVAHPACMIRKSILTKNNINYEEAYSPAEDYMLWIRLLDKTMFANLDDILIKYRDFEGNTSHLQSEKMENMDALIKNYAQRTYPYFHAKNTPPMITNTKSSTKLFGFLPILSYKKQKNQKIYKILGLPIWKIKHQITTKNHTVKHYLFNLFLLKETRK